MNRRDFLKKLGQGAAVAGAGFGFPTIVNASALGRGGRTAPSNRLVMGMIGYGWMGSGNLSTFLQKDEIQVVGVCDVDSNHLAGAKKAVDDKYGNQDCATYTDFYELIGRGDLDTLMTALPDHWHAIPAIAAMKAGIDVYGEKPLSHNLLEGRAMCDAVKRYGRIWQTGSWQRSTANFHRCAELVRNGRIGKVRHVEVGLGQGHSDFEKNKDDTAPRPAPPTLDYERWLGPAPYEPYNPAKIHKSWRWHADYGGGMLSDWVCHHLDIAHWGLDLDHTGPVEIEGMGYCPAGQWNTPTDFEVYCKYANGVTITVSSSLRGGCKWIGDNGWIWVTRNDQDSNPKSVLDEFIGSEETHLYKSTDHWQNFIDCVKSREPTITPCETSHRSTSVAHLGHIAIKTGRKLHWDPKTEQFANDPEANRLLGRPMRSPWALP